jgi:OHCU decarboxylase
MQSVSISKIDSLNAATPADFVQALGSLYEHSPWVPERAAALRPFTSVRALHDAMVSCARDASRDEQIALVRAHPELAGKEAVGGVLTAASASEQGRLGLDRLNHDEFERLAELNRRYQAAFGFPCIIALRLHQTRDSVLAEFERRLKNDRETELYLALAQIEQIVRGRLAALFGVASEELRPS